MDAPYRMTNKTSTLQRVARAGLLAALATGIAFGTSAHAETFQSASQTIDQRLTRALEELGTVRDRIAKDKIPLSRSVSELEEEVLRWNLHGCGQRSSSGADPSPWPYNMSDPAPPAPSTREVFRLNSVTMRIRALLLEATKAHAPGQGAVRS
jgi:hypothetical protein